MMRVIITLLFLLAVFPSYADFQLDLSKKEVFRELEITTVQDIKVGDSGYIRTYDTICINKKGVHGVALDAEIVTDRGKYTHYYKLTILPNKKVAIDVVPYEAEKLSNALKFLLRNLVSPALCKNLKEYGAIVSDEVYSIDRINGADSLSELIKMYSIFSAKSKVLDTLRKNQ